MFLIYILLLIIIKIYYNLITWPNPRYVRLGACASSNHPLMIIGYFTGDFIIQ